MKIGIVGPIWLNIPPAGYGGTEEVVFNLVSGLVKKGHDVTLFGPKTAQVPSKLIATVEKPLRDMDVSWSNSAYTLFHITQALDRKDEFDVLHVHLNKSPDYSALPLTIESKTPVVFTLHFRLPSTHLQPGRKISLEKYSELPFTSISDSQRSGLSLNYIKTVYNALNVDEFPYSESTDDYYAWIGRVHPDKGTHLAIQAALKAGVTLKVMGAVDRGDPVIADYYDNTVKPLIDGKQVIWMGEVGFKDKTEVLSRARAMLNPIQWEEPFGLVMVESQAVGTPVISFNRGAAKEIIVDKTNGFLVQTLDEMVEKIKEVSSIERKNCRKNVEERFSIGVMTNGYEEAYHIAQKNWKEYQDKQKARIESYKKSV